MPALDVWAWNTRLIVHRVMGQVSNAFVLSSPLAPSGAPAHTAESCCLHELQCAWKPCSLQAGGLRIRFLPHAAHAAAWCTVC